jgi:predicted HTH domain antitoxin
LDGFNVQLSRPFTKEELVTQKQKFQSAEKLYNEGLSVSKAAKLANTNYYRFKLYLIKKNYPIEF